MVPNHGWLPCVQNPRRNQYKPKIGTYPTILYSATQYIHYTEKQEFQENFPEKLANKEVNEPEKDQKKDWQDRRVD